MQDERCYFFQTLQDEKETGSQNLAACEISAEKLHPETSVNGRDMLRLQQHEVKEQWEIYSAKLAQAMKQNEQLTMQLQQYEESEQELQLWLNGMETAYLANRILENTLAEKLAQLAAIKASLTLLIFLLLNVS